MARYVGLGTLTISLCGTASTSFDLWLGRTEPSAVPDKVILHTLEDTLTGTVTVQWSDDDTNFVAHYDSNRGANVTLLTARIFSIDPMQRYIRVNSSAGEADEVTVTLFGLYLGRGV